MVSFSRSRAVGAALLFAWATSCVLAAASVQVDPKWDMYYSFDDWGIEPQVFFDTYQSVKQPFPLARPPGEHHHNYVPQARFGRGAVKFTGGEIGVLPTGVPMSTTSSFTVCTWVRSPAYYDDHEDRVLFSTPWAGAVHAILLTNNSLGIAAKSAYATWSRSGGITPIYPDTWTHICAVKNETEWTLFQNGYRTAGLQTDGQMYNPGMYSPFYFMGVPSSKAFIYSNTWDATLDNLKIAFRPLTRDEILHTYQTEGPAPDVKAYPQTFSANMHAVSKSWGSSLRGMYSTSTDMTGPVVYDLAAQRAGAMLKDKNGVTTLRYLFGTENGQMDVTIISKPGTAASAATCSWTIAWLCPEFSGQAVCRRLQDGCFRDYCPGGKMWHFEMENLKSIPIVCTYTSDGGIRCEDSVTFENQTVVVRPDGVPSLVHSSTCNPSHQSISCESYDRTYTDVKTSNVDMSMFMDTRLSTCIKQLGFCDALCNHHGACQAGRPGICVCDAGWTGARCQISMSCTRGEWTDWSECSATCAGGTQTRSASMVPPAGSSITCTTDKVYQSRACNLQPCAMQCAGCVGGTSGPCKNPANNVCYDFYVGTAICPAGTFACGSTCQDCSSDTVGPCKHDNDNSCVPFLQGTTMCTAGSYLCGAQAPADGMCRNCWPLTKGPCQQSNSVCWDELPNGECPVGTTRCGDKPVAVAAIVSIDLHMSGVSAEQLRTTSAEAFHAAIADIVGDPTISGVTISVSSAGRSATVDGTWVASPDVNVGIVLAREAYAGGNKTLHQAGDEVGTCAQNGTLAEAFAARGLYANVVSLNSAPAVVQPEGKLGDETTSGTSTSGSGASSSAGLATTTIILIACGCGLFVLLIIIAVIYAVVRRRNSGQPPAPVGQPVAAASAVNVPAPAVTAAAAAESPSAGARNIV